MPHVKKTIFIDADFDKLVRRLQKILDKRGYVSNYEHAFNLALLIASLKKWKVMDPAIRDIVEDIMKELDLLDSVSYNLLATISHIEVKD